MMNSDDIHRQREAYQEHKGPPPMTQAESEANAAGPPVVVMRAYTLAEIRDGTGFAPDTRFAIIPKPLQPNPLALKSGDVVPVRHVPSLAEARRDALEIGTRACLLWADAAKVWQRGGYRLRDVPDGIIVTTWRECCDQAAREIAAQPPQGSRWQDSESDRYREAEERRK